MAWGSCPSLSEGAVPAGWQCGTLEVPLSYAAGAGSRQTVRLALARRPARGPGKRLGVLFGNPGGPGADGLGFTGLFQAVVGRAAERYDLVTWDPRGVGHSRPSLRCGSEERMEELYTHQSDTRTDKGVREKVRTDQEAARLCRANAAALVANMSTMDTVHDLDRLRQALGRPRLDYIGFSYGTVIGAVYANRFPGSTGRMVLHGVVDSRLWLNDLPAFMHSDTVEGRTHPPGGAEGLRRPPRRLRLRRECEPQVRPPGRPAAPRRRPGARCAHHLASSRARLAGGLHPGDHGAGGGQGPAGDVRRGVRAPALPSGAGAPRDGDRAAVLGAPRSVPPRLGRLLVQHVRQP
ncbi:alpha/beta fold hydrolase [Streptomyces thioluteus]|uniref:alpha/beta fold hydrolase n=1 Tax=Streptomyces thioluteus TaxID=66431 RepID=UPI0031EF901C